MEIEVFTEDSAIKCNFWIANKVMVFVSYLVIMFSKIVSINVNVI